MFWLWFAVTWAAFMSLLVLTIIHENRRDAILRAQINCTLARTLDVYPERSEQAQQQLHGCAQSVSSSGTATWNGRAKVG